MFATIAAYSLISIEIIIMISPFAMYFYSVYGPVLEYFAASPYLSWTTEFFLPHMVFTQDPIIVWISYLQVLLIIGLVLFFSAAIPLYYGRFTKKGVVQGSFYSKIRHPQYLFLAISGFGLLIYWPRFIILVMYVTMLFIYYILARNEEWRMKREVPGVYEEYMQHSYMFIPGEPGGKIYNVLFGWVQPKWFGILLTYCLSLVVSISIAMGLRAYTVSTLKVLPGKSVTFLPVFPRPAGEVEELYRLILSSEKYQEGIKETGPANLVYVFPGDFFLTALVTDESRRFSDDMIDRFPEIMEWHEHKFSGGLGRFFRIFYNFFITSGTIETDFDVDRFVFIRVEDSQGNLLPDDQLFKIGTKRKSILIVDVDEFDREVLSVMKTSPKHKWGSMPMPSF